MSNFHQYKKRIWILALCLVFSAWNHKRLVDYFEISKNLDILAEVYRKVNQSYVNDVMPGELIRVAIDAMLKSLDPYTNFYSEAQTEEFRLRTSGSYDGIGFILANRKNKIIVKEVLEGFPADLAGVLVADEILRINDQAVEGKKSKELAPLLYGSPGTRLSVVVRRGQKEIEFDLERGKVDLKNVTHAEQIEDGFTYVKLAGFSSNAAKEIKESIAKIGQGKTTEGIIIDLRGNGGGLLMEAIKIVNLFISKNQLVVDTKGRLKEENRTYKTFESPLDTNIHLAILIDGGSASASEIVAGSLQDYDRAILIGQKSFGKGLVQKPMLLSYNTQMKITVSKYFLPSGRLIQALEYKQFGKPTQSQKNNNYFTKNKRQVKSGQGITPDVWVQNKGAEETIDLLQRNWLIFDFVSLLQKRYGKTNHRFRLTDKDYKYFKAFVQENDSNFESTKVMAIKSLVVNAQETQKHELAKKLEEALLLSKRIDYNKLDSFKNEIKRQIEMEYVQRYHYKKGAVQNAIENDVVLKKAIGILKDEQTYDQMLNKKR